MSAREVIALGTASQVPTRTRSHQSLFLRFDGVGVLVDPGEGTQRQMLMAGVSSSEITAICLTHLHGDHCLGLPGVAQLLSLDRVSHPVPVFFPASGQVYVERLLSCSIFDEQAELVLCPVSSAGEVARLGSLTLSADELEHRVPCVGWRLVEPDGLRFIPEKLSAAGVAGPAVTRLEEAGTIEVGDRWVSLDEVTEERPGQVVSVVMDTGVCEGARRLLAGADLAVVESTFLASAGQQDLARISGHLTAAQAASLAVVAGVRRVVLTHFSRRQTRLEGYRAEASALHPDVHVAADLDRVPLPPRR